MKKFDYFCLCKSFVDIEFAVSMIEFRECVLNIWHIYAIESIGLSKVFFVVVVAFKRTKCNRVKPSKYLMRLHDHNVSAVRRLIVNIYKRHLLLGNRFVSICFM